MDAQSRLALHVLAFLFFRMGEEARAGRIYAVLAALPPSFGTESADAQALLGLAAATLTEGRAEEALAHADAALQAATSDTGNTHAARAVCAAAHSLRARALSLLGRHEEAVQEMQATHSVRQGEQA